MEPSHPFKQQLLDLVIASRCGEEKGLFSPDVSESEWTTSVKSHWVYLPRDLFGDVVAVRRERARLDVEEHFALPIGRAWLCLLLNRAHAQRELSTRDVLLKWKRALGAQCRAYLKATNDYDDDASMTMFLLKQANESRDVTLEDSIVAQFRSDQSSSILQRAVLAGVLGNDPESVADEFESAARDSLNSGNIERAFVLAWGLATRSSFKKRAAFCSLMRDGLVALSKHFSVDTAAFASIGLKLYEAQLTIEPGTTRVVDLVHVTQLRTTLTCPLCGCLVGFETDDDQCLLHRAVKLLSAGDMKEGKAMIAETLDVLWFDPVAKRELLEVVCSVACLSETRIVSMDEIKAAGMANKKTFDMSTRETFAIWIRDKNRRMIIAGKPTFRYQCALRIRGIWTKHTTEGFRLKAVLEQAREEAVVPLAQQLRMEKDIGSFGKAVDGLESYLRTEPKDSEGIDVRLAKLEEKQHARDLKQLELDKFLIECVALRRLKDAEEAWAEFWERSGLAEATAELDDFNARIIKVRAGSIGREGEQFEHECEQIIEKMFGESENRLILRGVKLRGVQFPEKATGEFDFLVSNPTTHEVLEIIEMKRSPSQVRGNLLKKMSSVEYLCQDFRGAKYEGLKLTKDSFTRFEGKGFFKHMWFFAREPVRVSEYEDVYGMFIDSEDAFLLSIIEVLDEEIMSEAFISKAYKLAQERYPVTEEDMADYARGTAAFLESVAHDRFILVKHLLSPEEFQLPLRHRSVVLDGMDGVE